jgi:hypothetical protein
VRKVLLMEYGEKKSEEWVTDFLRRNIFPSFSMDNIFHPTNVISVNSYIHGDYEYM